MTTDTDHDLAARLRPILDGWYVTPPPTDAERLIGTHPGGATGFYRDMEEAAKRWVTSRASAAGEATNQPPQPLAATRE